MPNSLENVQLDRLFVPLSSDPYEWFEDGTKQWELRRTVGQFGTSHIYHGRMVELRHGYSTGRSMWGVIREVRVANSIDHVFSQVPYHQIIPTAQDESEAFEVVEDILGTSNSSLDSLIAFRVSKELEQLEIDSKYLPSLLAGRKTTTIRKGKRSLKHGPALLRTDDTVVPIKISDTTHTHFKNLTVGDAVRDGFDSLKELSNALREHYPGLRDRDPVTVIEFAPQIKQ